VSGRAARWLGRAVQLAVVAACLALGVHAYRVLIRDGPTLHADETGHALPAARMALALGEGDVAAFAEASLRELVWPFLHPWLIAAGFLLSGISADVARLPSLLAFLGALGLVPALARALHAPADEPGRGAWPPLLGWPSLALLAATAPWFLVCSVMSETLGMLLTIATLLCAARAACRREPGPTVLAGLLAAAAFLTKFSYGAPLVLALLAALAWRARQLGPRPLVAAAVASLGPLAAWAGLAFAIQPRRLPEFLGILVNRDEGLRGLPGFLFYASELARTLGWLPVLAGAPLLALAAARWREARRLPALLFVGCSLLLLTLHPNKQWRHLVPVLPALLVLAETEAAFRLREKARVLAAWPILPVLALAGYDTLASVDEAAAEAARLRGSRAILAFAADHVPWREPVLFLGTTGLLPHFALTWEILERERREPQVEPLPFPGDRGWEPRFRAGYPAEPRPEYGEVLARALDSSRYGSVVTLALSEGSPFRPAFLARWDAWGQNYVRAAEALAPRHGYVLAAERSFPADGARIGVFVRQPQPGGAGAAPDGDSVRLPSREPWLQGRETEDR